MDEMQNASTLSFSLPTLKFLPPASFAMGISIRGIQWHSENKGMSSEGTGVQECFQGMEQCALPLPMLGSSLDITDPSAIRISIVATLKLK